jgi:hypothetical protein
MENLLDKLKAEATSDCVAFAEFMLQYKKGEDILYCFFEGFEDRTYYSFRIEHISKIEGYVDYVCGGKDEVLKVHDLIKKNPHYKNVKTGFFVDSDFDDNQNISNSVYVTPTYSIENLYCLKESFEKILIAEFKMKRDDNDFKKCVKNYLKLQDEFNLETLQFNSWLACQADYRNANNISTRLNIEKKVKTFFEKLVCPDLSTIKKLPELQTKDQLQNIFAEAPIIEDGKMVAKLEYLKTANHTEKFRGKFLMKFLENYLNRLQSIFGMKESLFDQKYSCKLRVEYPTMCSNLTQYAKTTTCLKQYIEEIN